MYIYTYIYIYIYPTSPLCDRWFRSSSNQIIPLPTLSPCLRSGGSGSVAGEHPLRQPLMNCPANASKSAVMLKSSLMISFFFLLPLGVL